MEIEPQVTMQTITNTITTTTHSATCATNQSDISSEYPDNIFYFDEVAEVYKGDNVMNIDYLEAILPTNPPSLLVDETERRETLSLQEIYPADQYSGPADQYTGSVRDIFATDHYLGPTDQYIGSVDQTSQDDMMESTEWNVGEWKDTAEYWKWILEDDANILADSGESATQVSSIFR